MSAGHVVSAALLVALMSGAPSAWPGASAPETAACGRLSPSRAHVARVERTLRATRDVWGEELIRAPDGPTYNGARRYLPPLLLARAAARKPLTDSGVHYLAFGRPAGPQGSGSVPLHVADGSQIVSQRWQGRKLTIGVGRGGRERYGSCLSRLTATRLAAGYLPILQTAYNDAGGTRYRQESFAAPVTGEGGLASYVRVSADTHGSADGATIRLTPSEARPVAYPVAASSSRTVYVAWLNRDSVNRLRPIDRSTYETARRSVRDYWPARFAEGAEIVVPERRVMDAMRNLLIQNLVLTWRYSVGNPYQELATADGIAAAGVIGAYGFADVNREILRTAFAKKPTPFPNWKIGAKLAGTGLYDRLFHDGSFVEEATPVLAGYLETLRRQIDASPSGLLPRERFSQDIAEPVIGLHAQAVVWQGLRLMASAWARTGHPKPAATSRRLAARLGLALREAVRSSERRLADGSLFVPVRLLDGERPYASLSASRAGSYWNLVVPYALASGLFEPGSREAAGVLRYMLLHGSRLLGLVRARASALYGEASRTASGTDQVYGLSMARFLADNDRPNQLVLSLYGQLAAGMAPGTFVSGEAASVTPLDGGYYRSMFLPPNGTSNAAFLETLRLMLVHETSDRVGRPRGLELAYATPRAWLAAGNRIAAQELPTSFGPLTYSLVAKAGSVRISIDVPRRSPPQALSVRLRLPRGQRIDGVTHGKLLADGETITLTSRGGHIQVDVSVAGQPR